jgi:hypothetical protein
MLDAASSIVVTDRGDTPVSTMHARILDLIENMLN